MTRRTAAAAATPPETIRTALRAAGLDDTRAAVGDGTVALLEETVTDDELAALAAAFTGLGHTARTVRAHGMRILFVAPASRLDRGETVRHALDAVNALIAVVAATVTREDDAEAAEWVGDALAVAADAVSRIRETAGLPAEPAGGLLERQIRGWVGDARAELAALLAGGVDAGRVRAVTDLLAVMAYGGD